LNTCVDFAKNNKASPVVEETKKPSQITLQDCLNLSVEPEQLGEDNQWYCNKCKGHVRAFKKMEIYKAPMILMIQLKRFKSGMSLFKSKIESKVEFPTEGLDLAQYVINHELPMEYEDLPEFIAEPEPVVVPPTTTPVGTDGV